MRSTFIIAPSLLLTALIMGSCATEETKKEEVDTRKPQINDTIISMLNAKKPEELLKKEGKDYLREEIKTSINNFMTDGQVIDIYYVNFQIN